ncbi:MAG: septum formation initiator family protein [Prevotellaceae bacterium]|nr:septum formation initiator family protein [Prevotella sp.]MDD7529769.1 septum formation initiator family protein [Prevotellaceae bacterium]
MNHLSRTLSVIGRFKYLITIVLGIALVGFIDENSFKKRIEYYYTIKDLKKEIGHYQAIYARDSAQLVELSRYPGAMTKIARERYMMKTDDEDIFVLSDDAAQTGIQNETTN